MARISLAGFKDPVRRPRYIIWVGVVCLVVAAVLVVSLGVTSSRWFCADGCHKVQDDTIIAYQHSSHNQISCIACHIPVNADPISFLIHKVEAGLGVIPTLRNTYELPLNAEDEVALDKVKMPETICTQCHNLATRKVTPSPGIIIDHAAHAKAGYQCTICHNRVAHPEDFTLTLPGNAKHADFMKMDACFRCHGLTAGAKAPGKCATCHPKSFTLKPDFHLVAGFYPSGHAKLALADVAKVSAGLEEAKKVAAAGENPDVVNVAAMNTVSNCGTCHVKATFCDKCHGMEMPHSAEFKDPSTVSGKTITDPAGHPAVSKAKATAAKCEFCHHQSKTQFCNDCHHGTYLGKNSDGTPKWTFDPKIPWQTQHAKAVQVNGVEGCLGKCHQTKFCQDCHNRLKPLPSSHKTRSWLHGAMVVSNGGQLGTAKPGAQHDAVFAKSPTDCAVCHGNGGASAPFCMGCHKLTMPHPDAFKKDHLATGNRNPALCQNCHQFKEICSNCHHVGATDKHPWLGQHGPSVTKVGNADSCFQTCHKVGFCNACHNARKVLPASHKAKNWLHGTLSVRALHTKNYAQAPATCTYCHGNGGAKAAFCQNCHKITMPHPDTFGPKVGTAPTPTNGGDHAASFKANKLNRAICANCHGLPFCDKCHHSPDYKANGTPWGIAKVGVAQQHPGVVRKKGTAGCLSPDGCHAETYCSHCHVSASR